MEPINPDNVCHVPVLEREVAEWLKPSKPGTVFVDCTIGYGGHSAALARYFDAQDFLIGIDRDAEAIAYCRERFKEVPFRVSLHHRGYEELEAILKEEKVAAADRYLIDCGFSSPQIDRAERGFSFSRDAVIDMRMDRRQELTAKDVIQMWSEKELADLFQRYGEERFSRRIAKAIVRRRKEAPIETTRELADVVIQAIPARYQHQEGIHPATRVFMALRIYVNNELECLRQGIQAALAHLRPHGRIGILTYHSLEHRLCRNLLRDFCVPRRHPPGIPVRGDEEPARGVMLTRKAVRPCAAEQNRNPRSRSAQFRVMERLEDRMD
ncbi:MAG: 16S rRNA (cytosine(1402)-N(4))-methyltransferase RsmH [Candidatus Omnitrophica bacterium]|nr:16S rRNA (cytosine(1402)-N(4))-methyltransferase RsmH [Candidatus Omnitrophota bacterium]